MLARWDVGDNNGGVASPAASSVKANRQALDTKSHQVAPHAVPSSATLQGRSALGAGWGRFARCAARREARGTRGLPAHSSREASMYSPASYRARTSGSRRISYAAMTRPKSRAAWRRGVRTRRDGTGGARVGCDCLGRSCWRS
jgi:hypothetical protein